MFRNKKADILDGDKQVIGSTNLTLLPIVKEKKLYDKGFDAGVVITLDWKSFCKPNSLITSDCYFRVNGMLLKIIDLKRYDNNIECYLYECEVI